MTEDYRSLLVSRLGKKYRSRILEMHFQKISKPLEALLVRREHYTCLVFLWFIQALFWKTGPETPKVFSTKNSDIEDFPAIHNIILLYAQDFQAHIARVTVPHWQIHASVVPLARFAHCTQSMVFDNVVRMEWTPG